MHVCVIKPVVIYKEPTQTQGKPPRFSSDHKGGSHKFEIKTSLHLEMFYRFSTPVGWTTCDMKYF